MGAANATLTEALALLRDRWANETEGLLNGRYSFWLGSGISRERYPDLYELIDRLLNNLQAGVDPLNAHCPYSRALKAVLDLTTAGPVDITKPPVEWPDIKVIIEQLRDRYSKALDVELRIGGSAKELFWDVLKLQELYGDASVPPDAEHKFLALLIAEGIATDLVTTNWDPLIEFASDACSPDAAPTMRIVARNEEVAGSRDLGARLVKVHGCARKALGDPGTFKGFLVVTETHINEFTTIELKRPFRELVQTILREKPALFIGLSGQDHDLQEACIAASLGRTSFPVGQSQVLFAAARITAAHHGILKAIYRQGYADHAEEIDKRAALPLNAKPLLGSLYVLGLEGKISALLRAAPVDFTAVHRTLVERAIERLEALLCERYDAIADPNARWRQLADEVPSTVGRFLSIYRRQETPVAPGAYEPFSSQSPSQMAIDPAVAESVLPRLFLAIALFVEGESRLLWEAKPGTAGGENGQLTVEIDGRSVRVFLINGSGTGLVRLMRHGFIDGDARRAVVVYPSESEPRVARRGSPRRPMPGGPVADRLEIWLGDLVDEGQTLDELVKEFQRKLAA
jgi:hypothetical protein